MSLDLKDLSTGLNLPQSREKYENPGNLLSERKRFKSMPMMTAWRNRSLPMASGAVAAVVTLVMATGCGKSGRPTGPIEAGPAVQDVPIQVEEKGGLDPIANQVAKRGGSFTLWGGEYPKSLNMFLD